MIILEKPPREDGIAQELNAIKDKKKEQDLPKENNMSMSYWILLLMTVSLIACILL